LCLLFRHFIFLDEVEQLQFLFGEPLDNVAFSFSLHFLAPFESNSKWGFASFAGAFRRSELAGIDTCDVKFSADGVVSVRKSKTDQESAGREVGLPIGASQDTCPVRALRQWLDKAGISEGPVFRSVGRLGHVSRRGLHRDSIGKLVKRAAGRAGLKVEELGGHSLRAGCVTQAAINGVREFVIMRQTGHKTIATLRRYIKSGEIFRENAASDLGI
jgi:integrase